MSSAYWQTRRQQEQFGNGSTLGERILSFTKTWEGRCYSDGIPDQVPRKVQAANRAPSWRAIAIAILKNDHNLNSIGFVTRESNLSLCLLASSGRNQQRDEDVLQFALPLVNPKGNRRG